MVQVRVPPVTLQSAEPLLTSYVYVVAAPLLGVAVIVIPAVLGEINIGVRPLCVDRYDCSSATAVWAEPAIATVKVAVVRAFELGPLPELPPLDGPVEIGVEPGWGSEGVGLPLPPPQPAIANTIASADTPRIGRRRIIFSCSPLARGP